MNQVGLTNLASRSNEQMLLLSVQCHIAQNRLTRIDGQTSKQFGLQSMSWIGKQTQLQQFAVRRAQKGDWMFARHRSDQHRTELGVATWVKSLTSGRKWSVQFDAFLAKVDDVTRFLCIWKKNMKRIRRKNRLKNEELMKAFKRGISLLHHKSSMKYIHEKPVIIKYPLQSTTECRHSKRKNTYKHSSLSTGKRPTKWRCKQTKSTEINRKSQSQKGSIWYNRKKRTKTSAHTVWRHRHVAKPKNRIIHQPEL